MRRLFFLALAVGLAAPLARAEDPPETWADPSLEDALFTAALVVRGHIQAPLPGETDPRIAIEKIVAGEAKPGVSVPLKGAKGPPSLDALLAPPRPGDDAILILRQTGTPEKASLEVPTPSFGRFTVRNGIVAGCVRDSFVRVEMNAETYETFLRNAWAKAKGAKPDVAFVDSCRATLAALDPTAGDSALPAHIALEGLALGAAAKDAKLALRFFASPKFQVRVSAARVLERAGGEDAGDGLLRLALNDQDPVVRSVAISALAVVKPTPSTARADLLAHVRDLDATSTLLHVNVEDPRTNEVRAPMYAAFETLRALGAGEDAVKPALDLLAKDDPDTLMTASLHLAKMKAKDQVAAIVEKMRPADYQYGFSNETIGKLLEELTGLNLGEDREAWREYVKNEK